MKVKRDLARHDRVATAKARRNHPNGPFRNVSEYDSQTLLCQMIFNSGNVHGQMGAKQRERSEGSKKGGAGRIKDRNGDRVSFPGF